MSGVELAHSAGTDECPQREPIHPIARWSEFSAMRDPVHRSIYLSYIYASGGHRFSVDPECSEDLGGAWCDCSHCSHHSSAQVPRYARDATVRMSCSGFLKLLAATAVFVPLMRWPTRGTWPRWLLPPQQDSSCFSWCAKRPYRARTSSRRWRSLRQGAFSVPGLGSLQLPGSQHPVHVPIGHGIFYALATGLRRKEPLIRRQKFIVHSVGGRNGLRAPNACVCGGIHGVCCGGLESGLISCARGRRC